jgi:inosine-uridine nucleoside N-ribohydrolase
MPSKLMTILMMVIGAVALALPAGCRTDPSQATESGAHTAAGVPIILDTDIGTDVDDAGALAMLHALARRGEARILAVMSCNRNRWSAPAIDVINTYYGRPDIPIGASRTGPDDELWYHDAVPAFPHGLATSSDAAEAVSLYRRILAGQPDHSVTIVTIGWLTNVAALLRSGPDNCSALAGRDLVAAKVKELVAMGGVWPNTQGQGEYNFTMDRPAARQVITDWPGAIMFSGLGVDVMTGKRLMARGPMNNPVRAFYGSFLKANKATERSSWDQIAVLCAVRGWSNYFTTVTNGQCIVREDGTPEWLAGDSSKNHGYLAYKMPQAQLATIIEDLMLMPPGTTAR